MMKLGDDGTLDTVIVCSDCGEEMRFNYDPEGSDETYEDFVKWAKGDAHDSHDCPEAPDGTDDDAPSMTDLFESQGE